MEVPTVHYTSNDNLSKRLELILKLILHAYLFHTGNTTRDGYAAE